MSVKFSELQHLDPEELAGRLKTSRRELYELRFKLAVGQQENHREIRKVRKDIARILTAIHRLRWAGEEEGPAANGTAAAEAGAAPVEPAVELPADAEAPGQAKVKTKGKAAAVEPVEAEPEDPGAEPESREQT
ncbi:MAG: 50S ribosomal protein L29 [Candidatus Dormibacteraceae bacterium]